MIPSLAAVGAQERDQQGAIWRALLTVQRLWSGDTYDLMLRVARVDPSSLRQAPVRHPLGTR